MRPRALVTLLVVLLVLCLAARLDAQRAKEVRESGVTATAWMFDVTYAAAASAGYGALRLAGVKPLPAAVAVASVNVVLHVAGWARGEYRPSLDWVFDFSTRGAPALVLMACETKGRRWCLVAVGANLALYAATMRAASP